MVFVLLSCYQNLEVVLFTLIMLQFVNDLNAIAKSILKKINVYLSAECKIIINTFSI